ESRERLGIQPAVLLYAVARPGTEFLRLPGLPADADDGHLEATAAGQCLQRREDFLMGQIAGGAEEHKGVRRRRCRSHRVGSCPGVSACPPNSCRIADSTRPANCASPRELKRS